MAHRCFKKKGSNPPVCVVHNVRLVQRTAEGYGGFTFLVCPVSDEVINED
jgi:hypothetical protein